jgi:hypothetical protein
MSATCASCGAGIRLWPFRMSWCPKCHTFSCRKCRKERYRSCPVCETETKGTKYGPYITIVLLWTVLPLIVVTLVIGTEFFIQLNWEHMEMRPIDTLEPDEFVKVQGTLISNTTIASNGHDIVIVKAVPSSKFVQISLYRPNETLYAIGTVERTSNGTFVLKTLALSTNEHDFGSSEPGSRLALWYIIEAIPITIVGIFIQYRRFGSEQNYRKRIKDSQKMPLWSYIPTQNTKTLKNIVIGRKSPMIWTPWTILLLLFVGFLINAILWGWHYQEITFIISGAMGATFAVALYPTMAYSFSDDEIPVSIKIADDGFGVYYRDGARLGFRWFDVNQLKGPEKMDKLKDNERYSITVSTPIRPYSDFDIYNLSEENATMIFTKYFSRSPGAYEKHKPY